MVCLVFRRAAILGFVGVVILESHGDMFGVLGASAELLYVFELVETFFGGYVFDVDWCLS